MRTAEVSGGEPESSIKPQVCPEVLEIDHTPSLSPVALEVSTLSLFKETIEPGKAA